MYNTHWEGLLLVGPFVLVGVYIIIVRYGLCVTGPLPVPYIKILVYLMMAYIAFVLFCVRKDK